MKSRTHDWEMHGQTSSGRARKYALAAIATLLAAVWCGVWLLQLRVEVGMAATVIAMCMGLVIAALRGSESSDPRTKAFHTTGNTRIAGASRNSSALEGKRWSLDVFAAIDARRFAAVCETWFAWAGFDTRSQTHRTDEGVDIWLHAARMPGPVAIVRCRHWIHKPVGLQDMKEFFNVMSAHKSVHGTYTTTSTYTAEALQFAQEHGIDAVDGRGLLRRIQTRTRQSQQALLAVAYSSQA